MPIWDNDGTTSHAIGKIWDYNGSTATQIHVIYDNDGTSSYEIYRAEETLFSGLTQETAGAYSQGQTTEVWSPEYTNDGFASLAVTGTVGATVLDQGEVTFGTKTIIQGYSGGSWSNLKTYNCDGNGDISINASATVNINGYSKIRVYTYCQRANVPNATVAKAWTNNLKGIAT